MALASPCIGVCRLDPAQRFCTGCGRTLREIGDWPEASEARQREILAAAAPRALNAGPAHAAAPGADESFPGPHARAH